MDVVRQDLTRRKKIRRYLLLAGGVLSVTLLTLGLRLVQPAAPRVEKNAVWIDEVRRGPLQLKVRGVGTLVPEDQRWLTARTAGRVERLNLLPGATLQPGAVILHLSNPELEQEARTAELQLKAADAEFANLEAELQGRLLELRSVLSQTEAAAESAALEAKVNGELFQEGLVAELTWKKSQLSATQLAAQVGLEKQRLSFQQNAMEKQLAAGRVNVEQARQQYDLILGQVEQLVVRASDAGVLQRLPVVEGEQVTAGQNLAQVANPARLKAVVRIPETQARDVQVGQPASIDTRNGLIEGSVMRINPTVENGTVDVDVRLLSELPRGARADLTVEGSIELENLPDVIHVGRPAFARENSNLTLFRLQGGSDLAVRVPVAFGRSSVSAIEVRQGLQPGDRVILSDTSQWDNYDRIQID